MHALALEDAQLTGGSGLVAVDSVWAGHGGAMDHDMALHCWMEKRWKKDGQMDGWMARKCKRYADMVECLGVALALLCK